MIWCYPPAGGVVVDHRAGRSIDVHGYLVHVLAQILSEDCQQGAAFLWTGQWEKLKWSFALLILRIAFKILKVKKMLSCLKFLF